MSNTQARVSAAIASLGDLSAKTAFYGSLCYRLNMIVTDTVPTAATDCFSYIKFNDDFCSTLNDKELLTVIIHELGHIIYKHGVRKKPDHKLWNIACDYAINLDILEAGFTPVKGWYYNPAYANMTAEQIYADLVQNTNHKVNPDWLDVVEPDADNEGLSEDDISNIVDDLIKSAANSVLAGGGTLPNGVQRIYDEINEPVVDWKSALVDFAYNSCSEEEYSYAHLHVMSHELDMLLPTTQEIEQADSIMLAIDVSGSVSKDDLAVFISECVGIFKAVNPQDITVVLFDHVIQKTQKVCNEDEMVSIGYVGGGGTQIEPVFKAFADSTCNGLVILTDGYFGQSLKEFDSPLLWAVYDNPSFDSPIGSKLLFKSSQLKAS